MSPRNKTAASVPTPPAARWTVGIGGAIALLAAAAISFETLVRLAVRLGITPGWLLPTAIDVYAATATATSLLLPAEHAGRATAMWNARTGLGMSVIANAVYHALILGSWGTGDVVLTVISAWPPLIVERLLHLQGRLALPAAGVPIPAANRDAPRQRALTAAPAAEPASGSGAAAKAALGPAAGGSEPGSLPVADAVPMPVAAGSDGGNVVSISGTGRRSPADWAVLALPLWRRHVEATGATPTAPELAALLRHAHPELPVPRSDRSERNIRAATEDLAKADDETERKVG